MYGFVEVFVYKTNQENIFHVGNFKLRVINIDFENEILPQILGPLINMLEQEGTSYLGDNSLEHLLNLQNVFGETPLHLAIGEENLESCQILIKKGADVNIAKNKGIIEHCSSYNDNFQFFIKISFFLSSNRDLKNVSPC